MNGRRPLVLLSCALFLAGCAGDPEPPTWLYDRSSNAPNGEIRPSYLGDNSARMLWRIEPQEFGRPFQIRVLSDSLALVLDRAVPFLHLIDLKRGLYLHPLLATGEDDPRVTRAHRIALSPESESEFVAYDLVANTLTTLRLEGAGGRVSVVRAIHLSGVETVDAPVMLADGTVSVEPQREHTLRAIATPDGALEQHSGISLTSLRNGGTPPGVWRRAMEGQTCPSPNRNKLVRTFSHMGQVMVLDAAGNAVEGTNSTRAFDPQFEVRQQTGEVVFSPAANAGRLAYRDCGVTEDFVFTLFSGRRPRQTERGPSGSTQVHVFDWRANMVGAFRLQRDAVSLDVVLDGSTLVALEGGFGNAVVGYAVPRKYRTR
jgi:hypothetical protein